MVGNDAYINIKESFPAKIDGWIILYLQCLQVTAKPLHIRVELSPTKMAGCFVASWNFQKLKQNIMIGWNFIEITLEFNYWISLWLHIHWNKFLYQGKLLTEMIVPIIAVFFGGFIKYWLW